MAASVGRRLGEELQRLTPEQREAATFHGDVVVLAGPGSGKTRTIVARAGFLLEAVASPFRGVACMTYTNAAASEIRRRLGTLGMTPGRRLASSTVHGFCLNHILRPYSALVGRRPPGPGSVVDTADALALWQEIFDAIGIADEPQYQDATLTRIRRALASGESTSGFDDRYVRAAVTFERELEERSATDFEAMVSGALHILRNSTMARESLVARFPYLVIDEYQDLGSVLHSLVLDLRSAGMVVTAVGDPDQTIFEFTGSDPKYLLSLEAEHGFHCVQLFTNFRSGSEIIRACGNVLGEDRGHVGLDGSPAGEVALTHVEGDYMRHGEAVVAAIAEAARLGTKPHEIAVLYPRVGPLLTAVRSALAEAGIAAVFEKDARLPKGPLSKVVQMCASRLVAVSRQAEALEGVVAQSVLVEALASLRRDAGFPDGSLFELRRAVYSSTDGFPAVDEEGPAEVWLERLIASLELERIAARHPMRSSRDAVAFYRQAGARLSIVDIAAVEFIPGKVVLTNYHSAKGREFDVVILPGLVEREVPKYEWDFPNRRWERPQGSKLAAARREFYVAMTRARTQLVLITGTRHIDKRGRVSHVAPTGFLADLGVSRRPAGPPA